MSATAEARREAVTFTHRAFSVLTLMELHDVLRLRDEVFVVGQKITAEAEIDGLDPECVHVIGRDPRGRVVATARIFLDPTSKVGAGRAPAGTAPAGRAPAGTAPAGPAPVGGEPAGEQGGPEGLTRLPVKVGRIAVLPGLQRRGVGTALMAYVHRLLAGRGAVMSAQAHLEPWYSRLGWVREGGVYDEAGIPHVRMVRPPAGT